MAMRWRALLSALLLSFVIPLNTASAQQYPPSVNYETIMDTFFGASNGAIRFDRNVFAFVPEGDFSAQVAVLNSAGDIIAQFDYLTEPERVGVFAIARVNGFAEVLLTEPGIYTIVFVVNGQAATRMPVRLVKTGDGGDPFNPQVTYAFDGRWRTHAHITIPANEPEPLPELSLWVGGVDLQAGQTKDQFHVELIRAGEVIAHSKHTSGHIAEGHFKRTTTRFYHPHTRDKEAQAQHFTMKDLLVDGDYEVKVTRRSDDKTIRSYDFTVADGKIVPLKETDLAYDPHTDFILPRVQKKNANVFEMIEATWIRDGGNVQAAQ